MHHFAKCLKAINPGLCTVKEEKFFSRENFYACVWRCFSLSEVRLVTIFKKEED